MAQTVSLFKARRAGGHDWTSQELSEFYRVEAALTQAGIRIFSDRGQSDEGDPWFVFCRAPSGDVVIHFARLGSEYLIASETFPDVLRGHDFRALINHFAGQNPSLMALPPSPSRAKLFLHPSALLAAVVATAFFWMNPQDAVASEMDADALPSPDPRALVLEEAALTNDSGVQSLSAGGKIEGSDEHPQSRLLVLLMSIMTMAATFDWVSDHSVLKLVDDWGVGDVPVEERVVSRPLDPVLLTLAQSEEAGLLARHIAWGLQDATAVYLDDAFTHLNQQPMIAQGVVLDEMPVQSFRQPAFASVDMLIGRSSETVDAQSASILPADIVLGLGATMLSSYSTAPQFVPKNSAEQAMEGAQSSAGQEATSLAMSFALHEAEAMKIDLSIMALDAQQDFIVHDGYGLRHLVQRVSDALDGGTAGSRIFFQEIRNPGEHTSLATDIDIPDIAAPNAISSQTNIADILIPESVALDQGKKDGSGGVVAADLVSSLDRYDARIEVLVQAFLKNSPTIELLMVDGNVVLLERDGTRYAEEGFGVMAWALDDGSTLSLIGVLNDLPPLS